MHAAYLGHYAGRRIRGYDPGRTRRAGVIPVVCRPVRHAAGRSPACAAGHGNDRRRWRAAEGESAETDAAEDGRHRV